MASAESVSLPGPADAVPAVEVLNLTKEFPDKFHTTVALSNITAHVRTGSVTGLIGPDGAGKTTLMRIIAGLMLPDAGEVRVLGQNVLREPALVQASLSYMPQRFGLYEDLSVMENLNLYADLQGLQTTDRSARYDELLGMTGLTRFTERLAGKLSGGMKQKLGVACALVRTPRLLLLDEPTVGVDPVSRQELWVIIKRFANESGTTVLISTAYLDEAERCDEVILLRNGLGLGQNTPKNFSRPLKGRTFMAASGRYRRRQLEQRLRGMPNIVDAVIQGPKVRVVVREGVDPATLAVDIDALRIEPVPPRFEDAFVALVAEPVELFGSDSSGPNSSGPNSSGPNSPESTIGELESGARPDGDPIIRVRKARRMFGDFCAVDDISFTVGRGEVFGLLGANGAGKTTTFRMLCGLLPASAGSLHVAGYDLRKAAAPARARIGYMAQKFSLYQDLTVSQNLNFVSRAYGLRGQHREQRINWAVSAFNLDNFLTEPSGQLPLGYKQRLSLAAALMHEPDILFLDEPTSGVDPLARRDFWARVNALSENGVTVLVTTHFMEEAEYCDHLAIMANGRILTEGTPAEIKAQQTTSGAPAPTMEEAFIALIQSHQEPNHG